MHACTSDLHDKVQNYASARLPDVIESALEEFCATGKSYCLKVISACVSKVFLSKGRIPREQGQTKVNGPQLCSHVVERLISSPWSLECLEDVVKTVRELPINTCQARKTFAFFVQTLPSAKLHELPSIIFQLLLFSSSGCESSVIYCVVQEIEKLEYGWQQRTGRDKKELRTIQTTILSHVDFAVKQNTNLGHKYIQQLRVQNASLGFFGVAVLLTMSRHHTFKQASNIIVQQIIQQTANNALSVTTMWSGDLLELSESYPSEDFKSIISEMAEQDVLGSENILCALVELAGQIIDVEISKLDPKCYTVNTAYDKNMGSKWGPLMELRTTQKIQRDRMKTRKENFGVALLLLVYARHDCCRRFILQTCEENLATTDQHKSLVYSNILRSLWESHPEKPLSALKTLDELLASLSRKSSACSYLKLHTLFPICQQDVKLKQKIMNSIRKSLLAGNANIRLTAIRELFNVFCAVELSAEKKQHQVSPSSCPSQSEQLNDNINSALSDDEMELMCILRKCLKQEAVIRAAVYSGMQNIWSTRPTLAEHFANLLHSQLKRIEGSAGEAPIRLGLCVSRSDVVAVAEPLEELLSTAHQLCDTFTCKRPSSAVKKTKAIDVLSRLLNSLRTRVCESKVEDLIVETQSAKAESCITPLMHTAIRLTDALLRCALRAKCNSAEEGYSKPLRILSNQYVCKLFTIYSELNRKLLWKECGKSRGHTTSQNAFLCPLSPLESDMSADAWPQLDKYDEKYLCCLLNAISEGSTEIACRPAFHKYTFDQIATFAATFQWQEECPDGLELSALLLRLTVHMCLAATEGSLIGWTHEMCADDSVFDTIHLGALESCACMFSKARACFTERAGISFVMHLLHSAFPSSIVNVITNTVEGELEEYSGIGKVLDIALLKLVYSPELHKEAEVLSKILLELILMSQRNSKICKYSSSESLCSTCFTKHAELANNLVRLTIYTKRAPSDVVQAQKVATSIHKVLGCIFLGQTCLTESMPVVCQETVYAIAEGIFDFLNRSLNEVDSLYTYFLRVYTPTNSNISDVNPNTTTEDSALQTTQDSIHMRSRSLALLLKDMIVPAKCTLSDNFMYTATSFYKVMVKSVSPVRSTARNLADPSSEFKRLIDTITFSLTRRVYDFIRDKEKMHAIEKQNSKITYAAKAGGQAIPDLIFAMEHFEQALITYAMKTKGIYPAHFPKKRSISRDFKISAACHTNTVKYCST
mmetsp:Transcript_2739/g.9631  ORF Transcript_2739/g.9631 Transcript_2739/m.9631 type:complete len:1222 (+) Transcript_2739:260-3925(+)